MHPWPTRATFKAGSAKSGGDILRQGLDCGRLFGNLDVMIDAVLDCTGRAGEGENDACPSERADERPGPVRVIHHKNEPSDTVAAVRRADLSQVVHGEP
jgi:hypothetical protein